MDASAGVDAVLCLGWWHTANPQRDGRRKSRIEDLSTSSMQELMMGGRTGVARLPKMGERKHKKTGVFGAVEEPEMTTRGVVGRTTRRRAIDGVAGETAPQTTGF
jgi:hypothetical protein